VRAGIAIPNRNHGSVIGRLLDDVVSQSPDEVVVMDDASDDNSADVISARRGVRLVRLPQKSRDHNEAIADVALGMGVDYITMAGADDRIYPGFFDEMRSHQSGLVFCDHDVVMDGGPTVLASRASGFREVATLSPQEARERLSNGFDRFECGVGTAVRMDVHRWLVERGAHRMGPWIDSIGYSVAACIFGATYVPRTLAAFTASSSGSNWHVRVLSDPTQAYAYRGAIMQFFAHPDVQPLGAELLSAIARRWGA